MMFCGPGTSCDADVCRSARRSRQCIPKALGGNWRLGFQVLGGPLQTDVIEWIQQVEKVQIRRNNIVHSHRSHIDFSGTPAATTRKVRKAKRELEQVSQKWTPAEIDQLTGEISLVDIEGTYLVVELQGFSL